MPTLTPHPTPGFDDSMREVLSRFCTGVAVITAIQADGRPTGMAVQSFSSASLEPPLICFCPALASTTWPHIREAGRFAVNILAAEQQPLCRQFAVTGQEKFQDAGWRPGANGAPLLDGALATVECDLEGTFPGGDHLIALGRVTALERHGDAEPLLYFRRGYGRLRSNSSRSASIESARSRSDA
ncbi:flavin reductase family protein [Streptomyces sp. NBC_01197]|uniref:flavin reductase family protein n=1 Tax=Streptomyces sp. NBC_01197 TaxID=2903768 RepID=UPI002E146A43|nr:flavin reductase family protein [Streptomyces sp. NBC_01197]